jgi:hypothetical protein
MLLDGDIQAPSIVAGCKMLNQEHRWRVQQTRGFPRTHTRKEATPGVLGLVDGHFLTSIGGVIYVS